MLEVIQLPVLQDNYSYIIHNTKTHKTVTIDPALAEPIIELLEQKNWTLDAILNTHHHPDHVGGNRKLHEITGAKIIGFEGDKHRIPAITDTVDDNDIISVCDEEVRVFWTPGHTLGHIVYYFTKEALLFCGDVLFAMGCGRLFEGTPEQMFQSLQTLAQLPSNTRIFCAHEYTTNNGAFALNIDPNNSALIQRMKEVTQLRQQNRPTIPTTLALEKTTNPFLRCQSTEEFATIRQLKDHF